MDSLVERQQQLDQKETALRLYEMRLNALWAKVQEKHQANKQLELDLDHKLQKLEALSDKTLQQG